MIILKNSSSVGTFCLDYTDNIEGYDKLLTSGAGLVHFIIGCALIRNNKRNQFRDTFEQTGMLIFRLRINPTIHYPFVLISPIRKLAEMITHESFEQLARKFCYFVCILTFCGSAFSNTRKTNCIDRCGCMWKRCWSHICEQACIEQQDPVILWASTARLESRRTKI